MYMVSFTDYSYIVNGWRALIYLLRVASMSKSSAIFNRISDKNVFQHLGYWMATEM